MNVRKKLLAARGKVFRVMNGWRSNAIHLFLLSPPLNGSTVTMELIRTSPNVTCFPGERAEGESLPGISNMLAVRRRWDPTLEVDWDRVKQVFYSFWSPAHRIRFDKSPPHIFRAMQLEREFPNSYFIILIRNPYATIQGFLRRDWPFDEYGSQPFDMDTVFGEATPRVAAEFWVRTAQAQIRNLEDLERKLFFTYEDLTDNNAEVIQKMIHFLPELSALTANTLFNAHNITGRPMVGLKNLNEIKVNMLKDSEIAEINTVLVKHQDVLDFFNYEIIQ